MGTRDGRERERERERSKFSFRFMNNRIVNVYFGIRLAGEESANMKYIQSIAKAWDCSARGGNAKGEVNVCPLLMKISRGSSPRMPYPAHQA